MSGRLLPILLALACRPAPSEPLDSAPADTAPEDTDTAPVDTSPPDTGPDTAADTAPPPTDADGDGAAVGVDCDDADAAVFPGAAEVCDGRDDNCDGSADEGLPAAEPATWYLDADLDGYAGTPRELACADPVGLVAEATDCDDTRATVYPGSTTTEVPYDGVDTDCDGDDFCTDLDCDGAPDLVLADFYDDGSYEVLAHLYYASGGYAEADKDTLPVISGRDVLVQDLDGDGYLDIVTAEYMVRTAESHIYWGSASGYSPSDSTALPTSGAYDVLAEDLNGDGYTDLVYANAFGTSDATDSHVYWGSASGYSAADCDLLPTVGARAVAAMDLDGDGYTDLVFANFMSFGTYQVSSYVYFGSAAGFDAANRDTLPTMGAAALALADLNADGYGDIVVANSDDGAAALVDSYVYWGSRRGYSTSNRTDLPSDGALDVALGDYDGDGDTDIAFAGTTSVRASLYRASTRIYWNTWGSFDPSDTTALETTGAQSLLAADLDKDGYDDLVAAVEYGEPTSLQVYWGSATGPSEADRVYVETEGARAVTAGDLDGDGLPELVSYGNFGRAAVLAGQYTTRLTWDGSAVTWLDTSLGIAAPVMVGTTGW